MTLAILIKAMSNQLSHSELKDLLKENKITKEEFNSKILSLMSIDHEFSGITESELNTTLSSSLSTLQSNSQNSREKAILKDNQIITEILEEYSKIEQCPSFLQHQALLRVEDFKFSIEIYSKLFKLKNSPKKECWEKLTELFKGFSKEILKENENN